MSKKAKDKQRRKKKNEVKRESTQKLYSRIYKLNTIKLPVYTLRGFTDTLCGVVISYALLSILTPISQTDTGFSINGIITLSIYTMALILLLDDYIRARIFAYQMPCRSLGRVSLDLFVIALFGLSFFCFSKSAINFWGWFFIAFAYFARYCWTQRVIVESNMWKDDAKILVTEYDYLKNHAELPHSFLRKDFIPEFFTKEYIGLYQKRVKSVGWFSLFYFFTFTLVFITLKLTNFNVAISTIKLSSLILQKLGLAFITILPSANESTKQLSIFLIVLISFLFIEAHRFRRDYVLLVRAGFEIDHDSNYPEVFKTILWMPQCIKKFFIRFTRVKIDKEARLYRIYNRFINTEKD